MSIKIVINDLNTDVVSVEVTDNYVGEVINKNISLDDLLDVLIQSRESKDDYVHIGQLPKGYYNGRVSTRYENSFKCILVIPANIQPVNYLGTLYSIPYPSVLLNLEVKKGVLVSSSCFVICDENPNNNSELYYYPFANVYDGVYDSGNICWGGNTFHDLVSLKDLDKVSLSFFALPTNGDLFTEDKLNVGEDFMHSKSFRSFLEYLKNLKAFPKELLKEFKGITINDLSNQK